MVKRQREGDLHDAGSKRPRHASAVKYHRGKPPAHKPSAKSAGIAVNSLSWVRKRARDIERRLQKDDAPPAVREASRHDPDRDEDAGVVTAAKKMPAQARRELERELAAHKATLAEAAFQKTRSQMISKYHMVRFFERKKAAKLHRQLLRQAEACSDDAQRKQLEADAHVAEIDLLYSQYYPFLEVYQSLYPKGGSANGNKNSDDGQNKNRDDSNSTHGVDSNNDSDRESDDNRDSSRGKKSHQQNTDQSDQNDQNDQGKPSLAQRALRRERPSVWHEIEQAYADGGLPALEKIRDRRSAAVVQQIASKNKRLEPLLPTAHKPSSKPVPDKSTSDEPTAKQSTIRKPTVSEPAGEPRGNRAERRARAFGRTLDRATGKTAAFVKSSRERVDEGDTQDVGRADSGDESDGGFFE